MAKAKSKAQFSAPTDENPEWTEETFKRARPVEDLLPPEIVSQFAKRGRPKSAAKKVPVSLRLSPEVVTKFKAVGRGWQTAIDKVLMGVEVKKMSGTLKEGKKVGHFKEFKVQTFGSEVIIHGRDGKIIGGRPTPQPDKKRA